MNWMILVQWGAILGLVALSALFSGLTLGLLSLDVIGLQIVIDSGSAQESVWAKRIYPIRKRGNLLLCTLLLGNVSVNSLLSILMADFTSGMLGFFLSTFIIVIFGEIVPQATCSRYSLYIGSKAVPVVWGFLILFFPISYPISKLLDIALGKEIGTIYSKNELKKLLDLHRTTQGVLSDTETMIMSGALDFGQKIVRNIMTPISNVFMLPADQVLDFNTMTEILEHGFSRIPIYENEPSNIIGMLFVKDLALLNPEDATPIRTVLRLYNRVLPRMFDDTRLDAALAEFKKNRTHIALVHWVNTEGEGDPFYEILGIVTLEDVLEEILQEEIVDETDVYVSNVRREATGVKLDVYRKLTQFKKPRLINPLDLDTPPLPIEPPSSTPSSSAGPDGQNSTTTTTTSTGVDGAITTVTTTTTPAGGEPKKSNLKKSATSNPNTVNPNPNIGGAVPGVGDEERAMYHLTEFQIEAITSFLSSSVKQFSKILIKEPVLRRMVLQSRYREMTIDQEQWDQLQRWGRRLIPKEEDWLYVREKPNQYFTLILSGKVEVTSGVEGFKTEAGQFCYVGVNALTQKEFRPDFSARIISQQVCLLQIPRALYESSLKASLIQRNLEKEREREKEREKEREASLYSLNASGGADSGSLPTLGGIGEFGSMLNHFSESEWKQVPTDVQEVLRGFEQRTQSPNPSTPSLGSSTASSMGASVGGVGGTSNNNSVNNPTSRFSPHIGRNPVLQYPNASIPNVNSTHSTSPKFLHFSHTPSPGSSSSALAPSVSSFVRPVPAPVDSDSLIDPTNPDETGDEEMTFINSKIRERDRKGKGKEKQGDYSRLEDEEIDLEKIQRDSSILKIV